MLGTWRRIVILTCFMILNITCGVENRFQSESIPKIPYDNENVIELNFTAGTILSETVRYDPLDLSLAFRLSLYEKPEQTTATNQVERPVIQDSFIQGGKGDPKDETFAVLESGFLDLLIVIDNSHSMTKFQELIKSRFQDLLSEISNTNWRIAVSTTSSTCLRETSDNIKVLTRYDYDRFPDLTYNRFSELISAGNKGSAVEKGIRSAADSLIGDCGDPAQAWTREKSNKAVIIVSDEKNCGSASNEGCPDQPYKQAEYFTERVPSNSRVYGLLLFEDNFEECPDSGGYDDQFPSEYVRLIEATGGISGEICQDSYAKVLRSISKHVGEDIRRVFNLSFVPDEGSFQIKLDGRILTESDFILTGSVLEVTYDLKAGDSQIEVSYTYGGGEVKQRFPLSAKPDTSTLDVKLNGVSLDQNSYQLVRSKEIKFTETPEKSSKIDVIFKEDGLLKKSFPLVWPDTAEIRGIYVNNQKLGPLDYEIDQRAQTVNLRSVPEEGVTIALNYKEADSKKLEYDFPSEFDRNLASIEVKDQNDTNREITFELVDGKIVFPEDEVWDARDIEISLQLAAKPEDSIHQISLPEFTRSESIQVTTIMGSECGNTVQFSDNTMIVNCERAVDEGLIVDYEYVVGFRSQFVVGYPIPGAITTVYLNQAPFYDYIWEGNTIIFPENSVQPEDRIIIKVYPPIP
ncbi:MAG: VWA domain-containing protein [Pseudobacteriovorax sp.]|nr:VWA domain-containing protein [Pseudobacteriovorax sp.]